MKLGTKKSNEEVARLTALHLQDVGKITELAGELTKCHSAYESVVEKSNAIQRRLNISQDAVTDKDEIIEGLQAALALVQAEAASAAPVLLAARNFLNVLSMVFANQRAQVDERQLNERQEQRN